MQVREMQASISLAECGDCRSDPFGPDLARFGTSDRFSSLQRSLSSTQDCDKWIPLCLAQFASQIEVESAIDCIAMQCAPLTGPRAVFRGEISSESGGKHSRKLISALYRALDQSPGVSRETFAEWDRAVHSSNSHGLTECSRSLAS